jgi:hypothetical protein
MGSNNLLIEYDSIAKDGFLLGWINGTGGTLTSGLFATKTSEPSDFDFQGLFAGVKTAEEQ